MKALISVIFILGLSFLVNDLAPQVKLTSRQQQSPVAKAEAVETVKAPPEQKVAVVAPPVASPRTPCDFIKDYDWDHRVMMAIAMAESHCNPQAVGDTTLTFMTNGRLYGYSVGMFQVRILPGREACDSHDAETNVRCAYGIYRRQGLSAWSVYNNGKYLSFL